MKLTRVLAASAAVALIGGSTFMIAGAAQADPANPTTDYVVASQFGAEGSSYPASGWFTGTIANPGTITSGVSGLVVTANEQLLNSTTPATGLASLVATADVRATGPIAFQIPIFANVNGTANTGFTTLVPNGTGQAGIDADAWHVTTAVVNGVTPVLTPGTTYTIQAIEDALTAQASATPYKILAYGVIVANGFTATLHSVSWNGVTSRFTPAPTASATPTKLTAADASDAAKGVTATFTGFVPGETVSFGFGNAGSGGQYGVPTTADTAGSVTVHFVSTTTLDLGTYSLTALGATSGVSAVVGFDVVAAAITAPILPVTGADMLPFAVAGGTLLLIGLGFGFAARRRRTLAQD
jgi:LPXTG-motif cell wall-anchored protein